MNETESETEAALRQRVADLEEQFDLSEADRAARLKVIESQGTDLGKFQDEMRVWFGELRGLCEKAYQANVENAELRDRVVDLEKHFALSEADRDARLEVIERQGTEMGDLRQALHEALGHGAELVTQVERLEKENAERRAESERLRAEALASSSRAQALDEARADLLAALDRVRVLEDERSRLERHWSVRLLTALGLRPPAR
ncbi:MAG TPA: hypothetical protein VGR00_14170 [Thermoanaerobaculia bacterium]|nr:hypothetical protein [Thermoanaerobaculia bacterium]